jgi:hypothetical protein
MVSTVMTKVSKAAGVDSPKRPQQLNADNIDAEYEALCNSYVLV